MKTFSMRTQDRLNVAIREQVEDLRRNPTRPKWRLCGRNQCWIVAETCLLLGDHASAANEVQEMVELYSGQTANLYNAACLLAQCVSVVIHDDRIPESRRTQITAAYVSRAAELLRTLVLRRYRTIAQLLNDPDLRVLRTWCNFNDLTDLPAAPVPAENNDDQHPRRELETCFVSSTKDRTFFQSLLSALGAWTV